MKMALADGMTTLDYNTLVVAFQLTPEERKGKCTFRTLFEWAEKKGKLSRTDVGLLESTLARTNPAAAILVRQYEMNYPTTYEGPSPRDWTFTNPPSRARRNTDMEFFKSVSAETNLVLADLLPHHEIGAAPDTADTVAKDESAVCPWCCGSFPIREVVAHAAACKTTSVSRMQRMRYNRFKVDLKKWLKPYVAELVANEGRLNAEYVTTPPSLVAHWETTFYEPGKPMLSPTDVSYVQCALRALGKEAERVRIRVRGYIEEAVRGYIEEAEENGWTCKTAPADEMMEEEEALHYCPTCRKAFTRTVLQRHAGPCSDASVATPAPRTATPVSGLRGILYTEFKNDFRSWFDESRVRELVANEDAFNPKYVTDRWQLLDHLESTEYAPGEPMLSGTDVSYVQRALRALGERGKGPLATVARYVKKARAHGWTCATEDELMCVDTAGETKTVADEDEEMDTDCVVCMDKPKNTVLMPCKHMCVCPACAASLETCPMCRATVESRINVYL